MEPTPDFNFYMLRYTGMSASAASLRRLTD